MQGCQLSRIFAFLGGKRGEKRPKGGRVSKPADGRTLSMGVLQSGPWIINVIGYVITKLTIT